jgi:DNA uptake lipoprotein
MLVNAPYGKVADVAQYEAGQCALKMRDYISAREAFDKVPENYSFSTYLDDAVFYAGFCSFKLSSSVKNYDEGLVDKGVEDLEYFLRRYETSEYVPQAESLLNKLKHLKAERLFRIARFYEKQHKSAAALKYYQELNYTYGKTSWAEKAQPFIKKLREH